MGFLLFGEAMSQEQNPQIPTDTAPDDVGSLDAAARAFELRETATEEPEAEPEATEPADTCLLYTSDAADDTR